MKTGILGSGEVARALAIGFRKYHHEVMPGTRDASRLSLRLKGGPPKMFLCGNDPPARQIIGGFIEQFGWEPMDMGAAEVARALEPLWMLWCLPGFLRNEWRHAFKLLG